jgi:NAD(P)-dependent dehydrogenase (short-subunit alcohol dehydrogenase family)
MKTVLITGTTNGIGRVTALELARRGHRVVMANRNRAVAEEVRSQIVDETGNGEVSLLDLDLASLASARQCAESFLSQHDRLDILINNAGLTSMEEVITGDGLELQFEVNALGQLLLTLELLPALQAAAPSQVIFVTSMMHKFGKLDFDSFTGWKKYSAGASYNQSKLAMMLLARELAERLRDRGIAVNTLHPGAVNTGILDNYSKTAQFFLRKLFISPEKGSLTTLHLADLPSGEQPSGSYFVKCKPSRPHKSVEDAAQRAKLWDACCDLLGSDPLPA